MEEANAVSGKEAAAVHFSWANRMLDYFHGLDNVLVSAWIQTWLWSGDTFIGIHPGHRAALTWWFSLK